MQCIKNHQRIRQRGTGFLLIAKKMIEWLYSLISTTWSNWIVFNCELYYWTILQTNKYHKEILQGGTGLFLLKIILLNDYAV
jgi:hypothetical protein